MDDSTPILVGAGQFTERDVPPSAAQPPMGIAAQAARAALADTGVGQALAARIDTLAVIRIFPDSTNRPRMANPFGRAENPPRAVARRIGADPVNAIYGHVGGDTPQKLINEMAVRIAAGEVGSVLLAGAEALKTAQTAIREGIHLDWHEADPGSLEDRGIGATLATPHELSYGVGIPIRTYPLFENALRARKGHAVARHMLTMGALLAPFSRIAAANPFAFYGVARSPAELASVTAENRFICFPYPKWMNARDAVNQGSAVIMTSVGEARRLGIDPAKWVFLQGCGEAHDKVRVTRRVDFYSSPAIRLNSRKAFEMAGKTIADMDFIDIYSCFPSAVEIACDELGLAHDDPRGLTVTGGLPFFGGPGNSYTLNAIATLVAKLRSRPGSWGLITANGGYLSKHATGIYSTTPVEGRWQREDPASCQRELDCLQSPPFTETPQGAATIETCTVCFEGGAPRQGLVIGRQKSDGARFVAHTPPDPETLETLMGDRVIGCSGMVTCSEGRNLFRPA